VYNSKNKTLDAAYVLRFVKRTSEKKLEIGHVQISFC